MRGDSGGGGGEERGGWGKSWTVTAVTDVEVVWAVDEASGF